MAETNQLRAVLDHSGHIYPTSHWEMKSHTHTDFHELIVVLNGTIETNIRGKILIGKRGDVLFYPRGEAHAEQATGSEPLETVFMAWRWRPLEQGQRDLPLLQHDSSGRILALANWMSELSPYSGPEDMHMAEVLLDAILFEFERSSQAPQREILWQTRQYIQDHLAEPLHLDALARQAGLSKFHFCREFKKATHMTPMKYLQQVRVNAAHALLLSTPLPLKAIAVQVGFSDEFQFSRVFRRVTSSSPSQVRQGGVVRSKAVLN